MLEAVGEGEAGSLAGSAAGELSGRVPLLVLAGAGDSCGSASSQARFLQDRTGDTGMEAAVAQRNSANAALILRTQAPMVDNRAAEVAAA